MPPSTETSAAEIQAELQYLRLRNKELQSQLDKQATNGQNPGTIHNENLKEGGTGLSSPSSSLESGIELTDRTNQTAVETPELVGSSPNGLHHRRTVSAKETNNDKDERTQSFSFSSPFKRRGISPKAAEDGTIKSPEEAGFDNERNNNHYSKSKEMKKASDGGGDYQPPRLVNHSDEEEGHFVDVLHTSLDNSVNVEEDDGLMNDDSSHNKHLPKALTNAPCAIASTSGPAFPPFKEQLQERAGWLIGLLFLQSCSSFIIQYNQIFLQNHMVIVQFLTMLVGAGGNAGNQASVRVIRSLAVGTLNRHTMDQFLRQEAKMALCLSALIGTTGFIRAALFRTPPGETIAITASVFAIVAISVAIGSTLPLGMNKVGIDPANSSTSIQVIMDILGVLITVCVSSVVLSLPVFQTDESGGG